MTTFFRLLKDSDKGKALEQSVRAYRSGSSDEERTFRLSPEKFRKVPNTPFAYWVDDSIRELFVKLPPFESEGRSVNQGLATADDFRFVRAWWEVDAERRLDPGIGGAPDWRDDLPAFQAWCRARTRQGKYWVPFAKGGQYSPYYSDIHLVVNWRDEGDEMKAWAGSLYNNSHWSRIIKNVDYYFRPGVTWPRRTNSRFGPYLLPAGSIFADKGPTAFVDTDQIRPTLALLFSEVYRDSIDMYMAGGDETQSGTPSRSYEGGILGSMPFALMSSRDLQHLKDSVASICFSKQKAIALSDDSNIERRLVPQLIDTASIALKFWVLSLSNNVSNELNQFLSINRTVDEAIGLKSQLRNDVLAALCEKRSTKADSEVIEEALSMSTGELISKLLLEHGGGREYTVKSFYANRKIELVSKRCDIGVAEIIEALARDETLWLSEFGWRASMAANVLFGYAVGRWDLRTGPPETELPMGYGPSAPLPVVPPATLIGPKGLPAKSDNIASEEWLRARPDEISLPPPASIAHPTIPNSEYAIPIPWDGILVDDPDQPNDVVGRIRQVLGFLHGDRAEAVEHDLIAELGVSDLRGYLSNPSGFFESHLKTYSKSRRKAPIYWPISTKSGGYTVWIYYPRLTDATLFTVYQIVQKKTEVLTLELSELAAIERTRAQQRRFDEVSRDVGEVRDFGAEILRIANLAYRPDHDDGVPICAAPLYGLFRHGGWAKYLEGIWKKLEQGDFDWAHLAFVIWPDRVKEKAKSDRSIALTHRLEAHT
jgi:hypothetical protein